MRRKNTRGKFFYLAFQHFNHWLSKKLIYPGFCLSLPASFVLTICLSGGCESLFALSYNFLPVFSISLLLFHFSMHMLRSVSAQTDYAQAARPKICTYFTEAPVSIWLHLSCALNNVWQKKSRGDTNGVRAAAVMVHFTCRKLKDFCLYHVSPSMTTPGGEIVLRQEHWETILGVYMWFIYSFQRSAQTSIRQKQHIFQKGAEVCWLRAF